MCLILCAFHHDPRYPLIVSANRDEFYSRPTRNACFWALDSAHSGMLAGQDLTHGGTWLGMTRDGRFAAVTNIRTPDPGTGNRSRGLLASEYLLHHHDTEAYLAGLLDDLDEYAGFNLLVGDSRDLYFLNSRQGQIVKLQPGLYGVSNGTLDSDWPKVHRSKAAIEQLLAGNEGLGTDQLIAVMSDSEPAPDEQLPDTGISREMERLLSPVFIRNPQRDYGTRCSTAIIVDQRGEVRFCEQNYDPDARVTSREFFQFSLPEDYRDLRAMAG